MFQLLLYKICASIHRSNKSLESCGNARNGLQSTLQRVRSQSWGSQTEHLFTDGPLKTRTQEPKRLHLRSGTIIYVAAAVNLKLHVALTFSFWTRLECIGLETDPHYVCNLNISYNKDGKLIGSDWSGGALYLTDEFNVLSDGVYWRHKYGGRKC